MDFSTLARRTARWWPAVLAIAIAVAQLGRSTLADGVIGALALLLACGALAISRALPAIAFWTAAGAAIIASAITWSGWFVALIALAAASIATWGIEGMRRRALLAGPVVVVAAAVVVAGTAQRNWSGYGWLAPSDGFFWATAAVLAWGAVLGARAISDAVRAEQSKEQAVARTTVVESELRDERLRADLTHDFHDVMAHSLAVLAAQAEGLRLSHRQHPERIDPVLTTISDTARLALVEVRQLLERVDDDARRPQPTSADIPGLVAQLRSAGPTVVLHDIGTHGHLSRLADIAAYRIVQESLTNALRHGGADIEVIVALTWTGPGLTLAVSSPIHDRAALRPTGRGIAGMHERARLAGGSLEVDADGDRFVVSAHLPYGIVSDTPTAPLSEDQLATLPVQLPPRPEDVVAPWIVEASRRQQERRAPSRDWSQATTVDLTPATPPGGSIRNPMAPPE